MRISKTNIKKNKQKRPVSKKRTSGEETKSEVFINVAFDRLNRCKSRMYSVPSEVGDIMTESLQCGVEVYHQAHALYKAGKYAKATAYAKAVSQFCMLLNNLTDENTENILKLPLPPQMQLEKSEKTYSADKLHPALKLLDSFIRKRLMRASKFYKSRLTGYHEIILEISEILPKTESYH